MGVEMLWYSTHKAASLFPLPKNNWPWISTRHSGSLSQQPYVIGTIIIPFSQVRKLRLRIIHLLQVSQLVLSHSLTHSFSSAPPYALHCSRCQQVTEQEYELNSGPMFFTAMTLFLPKRCSDSLQTLEAVYNRNGRGCG